MEQHLQQANLVSESGAVGDHGGQLVACNVANTIHSDGDLFETSSETDSAISLCDNQAPSRHCSGTFASRPPSASGSGAGGNRFHILDRQQVRRLCQVMEREVCINARCDGSNLPTIRFTLKQFLHEMRAKLERSGVRVASMRLNGGAATYVILEADYTRTYNDVDLIFDVVATRDDVLEEAKRLVFDTLFEFLPAQHGDSLALAEQARSCRPALRDAYVKKMIKVTNEHDRWSLVSLSNAGGRNLELKFVERMRRQYEFTVDSFHIILDSLLRFYASARDMTEHYYPTIAAESVFGNFGSAVQHLRSKTIFTRSPEEIRGGGLLRYCRLLLEGYRCAADQLDVQNMQQLMCSRFFIDFSSVAEQQAKLRSYLDSHFPGDDNRLAKHRYLIILYHVVAQSTICLMAQEMQQILSLIFCMAHHVLLEMHQGQLLQYLHSNLANLQLAAHPQNVAVAWPEVSDRTPCFCPPCNSPPRRNNQPMQCLHDCRQPNIVAQAQHRFNNFGGFGPFNAHARPTLHQRPLAANPFLNANYDYRTGCSTRPPATSPASANPGTSHPSSNPLPCPDLQ